MNAASARTASVALGAAGLLASSAARADDAAPAPIEVSVTAAPRGRDPGRVQLSTDEAARVPGTGGDALQAIGSLPGLARPAFDGGKLLVWGSPPGDSRVYVDGIEIPALYHGGGFRGVVSGALVESLELVPGAYGADYGRALGGMVRLTTRELPAEGLHATIGADVLDASAVVTSSTLGGRLRIAFAARQSYLDRILAGVVAPLTHDGGALVPIPRYHDEQLKASLALREDESVELLLLGSGDTLHRALATADPGTPKHDDTRSSFQRVIVRYARTLADGTGVTVTPFFGQDAQDYTAVFGPIPATLDQTAWRYGLRGAARVPFGEALAISFGLDAQGSSTNLYRTGSVDIPPREGDLYVFGQQPGGAVSTDRWSTQVVDLAPYLVAEIALGPVRIAPGLRADAYLLDGSRLTPIVGATPSIGYSRLAGALDPRVSATWAASSRLTLSAAAGIYHQPPDPADMSAAFGTPALTLQRAVHVSVGEAARLPFGVELEATAFYKWLDLLVVRSRLPDPTLAQALVQDGEGRSYGAQILVRRPLARGLLGWVAYTLSRSERRYVGDTSWRLLDYDQTHVLAAVASYERDGWSYGLRFRATTGAPRTPVVGSFAETTSGQFEPVFGAQNAARLPAFYQLDVRAGKRMAWSRAALELYLDLLDVTFHRNAEEVVYNFDYSRKGYITGLPMLAVLGAKVSL